MMSQRLNHPGGQDNAPAKDTSGTWVRVLTPVAGANWGSVFTPRLGQEVLIAFVGGDIDRPVVIGNVYNGQGQTDAQGNQINSGAAGAIRTHQISPIQHQSNFSKSVGIMPF